ncbi:MAG: primosomal protein N' [Pirellulaceae bacterium]
MDQQRSLFDTQPDPWDLDDQQHRVVASVVFTDGLAGTFDYEVPESLLAKLVAGQQVKVPLGRGDRLRLAYCVHVQRKAVTRRLKMVHSIADERQLLTQNVLDLTSWMSEYYLAPWGKVLETVVPAGVRGRVGTREVTLLFVPKAVLARTDLQLPPAQEKAFKALAGSKLPLTQSQLCKAAECSSGPVRALISKGLIETKTGRTELAEPNALVKEDANHVCLNADQEKALSSIVDAVRGRKPETILLHGVTGSGKTEIYIQAIEEVIKAGRQAIVLVPEISLTPQTQRRFRSRFENVAVVHSHMSDADRHWYWHQIANGEIQVVVGARSAVFAPTPQLGLIVIDEEHDGSFKQDKIPRYHARDVARKRAELEGFPLILGSATPSLESWQRATEGTYRLISMPRRVLDLPLPDVITVDLREEYQERYFRGAIGNQLRRAVEEALQDGGQVILLLNRRGYSTHIQCPGCGEVVRCHDCDIALTHHREGEKAVCHYCDYEIPSPTRCPKCGFEGIRYGGLGTQRLEAEVNAKFPRVTCIRMDSDTMQKPGSHEAALQRFKAGETKILLGTQMIAKGLDFPNVTLVGVINADTGLHLPDFRAAERTFQLVTQVAGRTGRGMLGGRVFVQTLNPDHPAIVAAQRHDFLAFALSELPGRQTLNYPPFGAMARVVIRGDVEKVVEGFADSIAQHIASHLPAESSYRVLGPAPAPIAKLRGQYRFHMILQGNEIDPIRAAVKSAQVKLTAPDSVQWIVDVDPYDML